MWLGRDQASNYDIAYSTIPKGKTEEFYYNYLLGRGFTFDRMVAKTREYFYHPLNYQVYLDEWQSTTLRNDIAANPQKSLSQCLEVVIEAVEKVHKGFLYNYNSSFSSLPALLVSACHDVPACFNALVRPATSFEGIADDLRRALRLWMCSQGPSTHGTYNDGIDTSSDEEQYYVDRRYSGNGRPHGNKGCQGSRTFGSNDKFCNRFP